MIRAATTSVLALLLAGCGGGTEATAGVDNVKLSADLEARAAAIEQRADAAAADVERESAGELARINAEAAASAAPPSAEPSATSSAAAP